MFVAGFAFTPRPLVLLPLAAVGMCPERIEAGQTCLALTRWWTNPA